MINGKVFALEVNLFAHSEKSFVQALSAENIDCSEVMKFSTGPQMGAGKEKLITLLADTMPWNAVAKVVTAWINAKSSRQVMITIDGSKVIHAKGYSEKDVSKLIQAASRIDVIDTQPDE